MSGLVFLLDKAGESLAAAEQALERAGQEIEILRARVAELEAEKVPPKKPDKSS